MKILFLLFPAVAPLAFGMPMHAHVRMVSFEKPGAPTALEAAMPGCDEKLYAGLVADAAAGSAKRVQDQSVIIRGGQRSKVEAIKEYPSSGENDPEPSE